MSVGIKEAVASRDYSIQRCFACFNLRLRHGLTSIAPPRKTWQAGASDGASRETRQVAAFIMPSAPNVNPP